MVKQQTIKTSFLGLKTIKSDLKSLSKPLIYVMFISMVVTTFFALFNVQGYKEGASYFIPLDKYNFVTGPGGHSVFGTSSAAGVLVAIFWAFSGLASFTGILMVLMITEHKESQWFWSMVSNGFFFLTTLGMGYIGDMTMGLFTVLVTPIGWIILHKKARLVLDLKTQPVVIKTTIYFTCFALFAMLVFSWFAYLSNAGNLLFGHQNNPYPHGKNDKYPEFGYNDGVNLGLKWTLDSLASSFKMTATILQVLGLKIQFFFWLFCDIFSILQFSGLAGLRLLNISLFIQYLTWMSLVILSIVRILKQKYQTKPKR